MPDDAWVAGRHYSHSDPGREGLLAARAEEYRAAVEASGDSELRVVELDSTEYPGLGFAQPVDVIAIGPFPSAEAALAGCEALGLSGCRAYQPGPPS